MPRPPVLLALMAALALAAPARADYPEAIRDVILPGYAAFAEAAAALDTAAQASCEAQALEPAFHTAFDAWMAVAPLRIGPAEEDGRALAILFWPDPKGLGAKAQAALLAGEPAALTPEGLAQASVAARGLLGLERLLWPAEPLPADPCPLVRATAADLARMAADLRDGWQGDTGFAQAMLSAGTEGNAEFLSGPEVRQAIFTLIHAGLEQIADQQLGRPLGSFDKPRPELAQARASGRSLSNVVLELQGLRALTESLTPDAPLTLAAFDHALGLAEALADPVFAGVATPGGRLKVEILQQAVRALRDTAAVELARELDVDLGFNAADGD
ncbi:imelysin family protein [Rhodobacter sp. Har01]|uniref:imelysin family protein n=1 Tax=Rhodobacter sp. Har01 TaxID=2883999 RepID=UPI001D090DDB|nr:imelysin family protein [Rhodobacter sp. Har01]MCB6176745.1 imelysin family protein [Rhodobacter sp. Har01]